ncbi:MAG: MFS transporter, partial [Bacillota bacterium]
MRSFSSNLTAWLTSYAPNSTTRSNIMNNIWDGFWYSVMVGLTQSFMGVYALALGATDTMLGWLTSLPALVSLLSHIPAAVITERSPRRLRVSVPFGLVFRSSYLLYAFIPFMPVRPVLKAWTFIILIAVMNFPGTVSGSAWTAMMGDVFPSSIRGRVFGDRNMILGIATMVCTFVAGPFLDRLPYPINYTILFATSFVALMLSTYFQTKMIEGPQEAAANTKKRGDGDGVRRALADQGFRFFLLALFVVHVGFNISASMWTILYVKVLGLSKTFIGSLSVLAQLTTVLTSRWWGRFADRHGNRLALFLSIAIFMPQPWLHNFVRTGWPLIPLNILSGLAGAGFGMVLFNALLDISPDESIRPSYVAVFHTTMGITGFAAPLIGVALYQSTNMGIVFILATVL